MDKVSSMRQELIEQLFPSEPAYRRKQRERAFFDAKIDGWAGITTLPKMGRQTLQDKVPWLSHQLAKLITSDIDDTSKALLQTLDGLYFETVLLPNARGAWTICVSSQIGCAMGCRFCATGAMGFKRNLTVDEIADQYRFWQQHLVKKLGNTERISNVVFMGMGEPLANYENIKAAILTWLENTDLGPTHIIVSTVGLLTKLEEILIDATWPPVRLAISLHSADSVERQKIVPSSTPDFLTKLADWSHRYAVNLGNRRLYLTFEYTLIAGVNDSLREARVLADYMMTTAVRKINLIPCNPIDGGDLAGSDSNNILAFEKILLARGIDATRRRSFGGDIHAACGQLAGSAS